ncbi:MAG: LacI family DNA-binding transcriptional regulator [Faecousia sp.]
MNNNHGKNVTISDIARATGVSKTTVSRYLNGKYNMMSPETRDRIEAVIKMSNYRPNSVAQSLRGRRSMQIGVVVSDISVPYCGSMVRAVSHTLLNAGYISLFVDCKDDLELEKFQIQSLLSRKVDGLIVNTSSYVNPSLIQVACEGTPVVLCDRYVGDYHFHFVGTQHRDAIRRLMTHLKEEGFARVALFTQEYKDISTRFIRRDAFLESIQDLFPEEDGLSLIYKIDLTDMDTTRHYVRSLLDSCGPGEVPAILAVNSICCTHLTKAINDLGLTVPGDVGLCAPDDWGWDSQFSISPLGLSGVTAFDVQPAKIGEMAAKTLLQLISDPDTPKEDVLLPAELTIRRSTQLRAFREGKLTPRNPTELSLF